MFHKSNGLKTDGAGSANFIQDSLLGLPFSADAVAASSLVKQDSIREVVLCVKTKSFLLTTSNKLIDVYVHVREL